MGTWNPEHVDPALRAAEDGKRGADGRDRSAEEGEVDMSDCTQCAAVEDVVTRFVKSIIEAGWASDALKERGKTLLGTQADLLPILNYAMSAGVEMRNEAMKDVLFGIQS
jgi:hypothetical protein